MAYKPNPFSGMLWQRYKWWIITFILIGLVFIIAGAFVMLRLEDDGLPTNFNSFYFVGFATKEIGFFSALFQRLIFNLAIFGLAVLVIVNKYLLFISCPIFWYGCYVFAINIFAFGLKYGFFNVLLLVLVLILFLLLVLAFAAFIIFDALQCKAYFQKFNILLWAILLLAEAVIEISVIFVVRYFVVIIV